MINFDVTCAKAVVHGSAARFCLYSRTLVAKHVLKNEKGEKIEDCLIVYSSFKRKICSCLLHF